MSITENSDFLMEVSINLSEDERGEECFSIVNKTIDSRESIRYEIEKWLSNQKKYVCMDAKKVGSIVMNCNPFTLGHRYLIEQALHKVDIIYIFVVEEDKSYFSFEDRIKMVKIGTRDLDNVIVIPSGKYILSAATLPGYFEKEDNEEVEFDAVNDLELFCKYIAPFFNINIRFAGEEPIDIVTNKYNETMKAILPEYGMDFVEIQRKSLRGEVISASRVRKYIKNHEYEKIKQLVMPQVYDYLQTII